MPCRSLFRKALPRKPVASADAHTTMVIAQPTEPHAVSVAGQITGLQQCRSSGRRNSSTGRSPSPGRPQNRQRCFSGNKTSKGKGRGRGGNNKQSSTPKRPGSGRGRGGEKPFKTNALTVTGLSGSQHPPKVSGEQFHNTFTCDCLNKQW